MRKKIIAGLLAVSLMFGAAEVLPGGVIDLGTDITVSAASSGNYEYVESADGTIEITKYKGSASTVTVPATIAGKSVKQIGKSAFMNCTSITSVSLPEGLANIGDDAFNGCSRLTSISLPGTLKVIGNYAFYKCTSLKGAAIPDSVKSIGDFAFYGCSSITSLKIPGSVTSIGGYVFEYCEGLKSVTLSGGITAISDDMFAWCTSLTSISIPSSVTTIGWRAFTSCNSLTTVSVPGSVTTLSAEVFSNCKSLTSVYLPSSISSVGENAFKNCAKLTVYGSTAPAQNAAASCGVDYVDLRMSKCKVSMEFGSHVYCGKALTPAITIKNTAGGTLVKDKDYTVSYSSNTNVGTATVTITGKGMYIGTTKRNFSIQSLDLATSNAKIALAGSAFTYTGSAVKPSVKVGYKDGSIIPSSQYTVTYSNNVRVGQATITIKGNTSNVTGYCTRTFIIKPKTGSVTVTSPAKGTVKATWTKNTTASGYEVICSKDRNFKSGVVRYNFSNVNTTSASSAKMRSGDVWYIAYRPYVTVNGQKYGDYSAVKTITVK